MHVKGFTFTRQSVIPVVVIVVLIVTGCLLPYLSMQYLNQTIEVTEFRGTLFPGAQFIRGIQNEYLPPFYNGIQDMSAGLNWANLGASMQQIGSVLAVGSVWCVLQEEINKFFWWPMHLSSYLLTLGPIPLLIGAAMLREQTVVISIGPGWIPVAVAGILLFLLSLRARRRLDSYAGI
ncbi:MAG TPA: hypothetical protein VLJ88_18670 [Propionibacteriaceae bacterium]|nr:hypothetical protein [Propionibacteriaceae bacterium]